MLVYIIPIVLCLLGIFVYDKHNSKKGYILFCFVVVYLAFLAGLSYRVGSDAGSYMDTYTTIPTFANLTIKKISYSEYQPLYFLLCVFCKSIIKEIWLMHLVQSTIVCFSFSIFLNKYCSRKFTGLLFFIFFVYPYFCYEIYKESIAVSIFLIGYLYLQEKKYVRYFIFVIVALGFHFSAIFAFIIPFISKLRFNFKFFICAGIAGLFYLSFLTFIPDLIPLLISNDYILSKFDYYTLSLTEQLNENWYIDSFLRNVFVPLVVCIWYKIRKQSIPYEWAFCFYVILGLGTLEFALLFERPLNYFLPFIVVALVKIVERERLRFKHVTIPTITIIFVFWLAVRGLFYLRGETYRLLIPYESIFTKTINTPRENVVFDIHPN